MKHKITIKVQSSFTNKIISNSAIYRRGFTWLGRADSGSRGCSAARSLTAPGSATAGLSASHSTDWPSLPSVPHYKLRDTQYVFRTSHLGSVGHGICLKAQAPRNRQT